MENGLEILVSELQKQNQILQIARREAEEKATVFEGIAKLAKVVAKRNEEANQLAEEAVQMAEQTILQTKQQLLQAEEKNKYLQFLYDQLKRMMFGAKRERFIANIDVDQMTLPFDVPEQPVAEQPTETIEYTRKKTNSRENHHGRL